MKKITLFSIICLMTQLLLASHYMGLDITYEELATPGVYRIYHNSYFDCSGAATSPYVQPVSLSNPYPAPNLITVTGSCTPPPMPSTWSFVNYLEVTPIAPGYTTQCFTAGAAINGVVQASYYTDYDLSSYNCTNATVTLTWNNCCRNYAITSGASSNSIYLGTCSINTSLSNSSPQFLTPPVAYICAGQTTTYTQGATDSNGDSLVYSLGACYSSSTTPVTYNAGYSASAPLGTDWNVNLDATTGDITFSPLAPGNGPIVVGVLCVYVTEYRNGTQIGQVARDIQVTVVPCNNNNPNISSIQNSNGVNVTTVNGVDNRLNAFVGVPMTIDIPTTDVDLGQNYTFSWDERIAGATFSDANNATTLNQINASTPPTARFQWTPTTLGRYFFTATIMDNAASGIRGLMQRTYVVDVTDNILTSNNSNAILSNCYTADFSSNPLGGFPPYVYQWSGDIPTTNQPSFSYTFATAGTYHYTLTVTDSTGQSFTENKTLIIEQAIPADAGLDANICAGISQVLGVAPTTGYTYHWTSTPPNTGFVSSPNSAQITVGINNSTGVVFAVDYTLTAESPTGCITSDAVHVDFGGLISGIIIMQNNSTNTTFTINPSGAILPNTYAWTVNGTNYPASTSNNITIANLPILSTVSVIVTDAGNCNQTFSDTFSITGIEEANLNLSDLSYQPNPANDHLIVRFTSLLEIDAEIQLSDVLGRVLLSEKTSIHKGAFEKKIDVSSLKSGYYFLSIRSANSVKTMPIIKQ